MCFLRQNDNKIISSVPEKTFLEKSFLLHELFTTNGCRNANRKSRHLYDLMKMMDEPFAQKRRLPRIAFLPLLQLTLPDIFVKT